jgi:hypothetical protein
MIRLDNWSDEGVIRIVRWAFGRLSTRDTKFVTVIRLEDTKLVTLIRLD